MKKKKTCYFCDEKINFIDYKDVERIINFTSSYAKIVPRYYTGTCIQHQRDLGEAIKRARFMGLLPFIQ